MGILFIDSISSMSVANSEILVK